MSRPGAWVYYDTFDGLARAAGLDVRQKLDPAIGRVVGGHVEGLEFERNVGDVPHDEAAGLVGHGRLAVDKLDLS